MPYDKNKWVHLIGNVGNLIADDVIIAVYKIMRNYSNSVYMGFLTPAEFEVALTNNHVVEKVPINQHSINIHFVSNSHWVTSYYDPCYFHISVYDSVNPHENDAATSSAKTYL